jgi:hypothetical protein
VSFAKTEAVTGLTSSPSRARGLGIVPAAIIEFDPPS